MASDRPGDRIPHYDRDFLLSPGKRNQIIELWEVEKFGRDSFGDPNAVSLYGMGRFPITLYKEQWLRILASAAEIETFIHENESKLKTKD